MPESARISLESARTSLRERLVGTAEAAVAAALELGLPVAVKLCGDRISHKTERDLVRLGLGDAAAVRAAAAELLQRAQPEDGDVGLLVSEMVSGNRELIVGLVRDPQFGPCVMLGLGGVLTEALGDVVFGAVPLTEAEARGMVHALRASHLLTRPFRGDPAVDEDALAGMLTALSHLATQRPDIASVDLNPVIVRGDVPIAVDALVEMRPVPDDESGDPAAPARTDEEVLERFRPLFHPRGIVVAGVSSHPGKFGFVTLHNLLRFGYQGEIFPLKLDGAEVLGRETFAQVADIPDDSADLVFVCTPNKANIQLLEDCAKKGIRAAFVASAGYGESGEE